jgi:hypothetical protein
MFFLVSNIELPKWDKKSKKEEADKTDHNNVVDPYGSKVELNFVINGIRNFVELWINLL